MVDNKELLGHMIDIKERLAVMESKQDAMKSAVIEMRLDYKVNNQRLEAVEKDLQAGKASVNLLKWMTGIVIAVGGMLLKAVSTLKTGN